MSQIIPIKQLSIGANTPLQVGKGPATTSVVLRNESPYELSLNFGGAFTVDLGPWIMDKYDVGDYRGFTGQIDITATNEASSVTGTTTYLVGRIYGAGEDVPGTYPVAFARTVVLTNPDRVTNDQESFTQQVVEATPMFANESTILIENSGTVRIHPFINAVQLHVVDIISTADGTGTINFGPIAGEPTGVPAQFFGRLIATVSPQSATILQANYSGSGGDMIDILNDGTINTWLISKSVRTQVLALTPGGAGAASLIIGNFNNGVQVSFLGVTSFSPAGVSGTPAGMLLKSYTGSGFGQVLGIGSASEPGAAFAYFDDNGNLFLPSPPALLSGHQETGYCGALAYVASGNAVGQATNFKMHLFTVTSITFGTALVNNSNGGPNFANINRDGFEFFIVSNSSGAQCAWMGPYTTVGNCLLDIDVDTQEITHHCNNPECDMATVHPFSAVVYTPYPHRPVSPGGYALAIDCPHCGHREGLATGLSSEDENGWDDGRDVRTVAGQSHLIRQLQRALGLPAAD